jgi:GTP1/Obg family GTP-binding protein
LEDTFNVGHVEGTKETLKEILTVCDFEEIKAVRAYAKARLKSLEDTNRIHNSLRYMEEVPEKLTFLSQTTNPAERGDENSGE